jgi:electron transfer flavoprotein beta subunit
MRKALAIGANQGIRVDKTPSSSLEVAEEIVSIYNSGNYDLLLFGKESIDYNGAAVAGLVAGKLNLPFVTNCIGLEVEGNTATVLIDSDEGKQTANASLPLVIAGQKGLVEESDLKIPNMRGIMQARTKQIEVIAGVSAVTSQNYSFEKLKCR